MTDEEAPQIEPEPVKKRRWKMPERLDHDPLAAGMREALSSVRERPEGPPPRRERNAFTHWLMQSKIRDDIFTRTVANVASLTIIAAMAAMAGLIQFDRQAWAAVALLGGTVIAVIVANVWPVRYLKRQWQRWVICWALIFVSMLISGWLFKPFYTPPPPSTEECVDVFLLAC